MPKNKSACDLLLYRTRQKTWKRGEKYADEGRVQINDWNEKSVSAIVSGTRDYQTKLAFRGGGISRSCTCPVSDFCKHMVALALLWDEKRGLKRPPSQTVERESVPPPLVSQAEINRLFNGDPLEADLDVLRVYTTEIGSWSCPHAELPGRPKISRKTTKPLSKDEVNKALKEMEKWSRRSNYDSYFCAGEMAAGFCELLDVIEKRFNASDAEELVLILAECVDWYYREFTQMVDSSDGIWIFPYVRIGKIVSRLLGKYPQNENWGEFRKKAKKVGKWWGEPNLNEKVVAGWKDASL